jgi:uncharacterized protein (UPF0332 family)
LRQRQQGLISKAQQSLEAARLLHTHGHYEFAAGRAYYSMFYVAEAFLAGQGLTFSKHSAVHAAFGQRFAKTSRLPRKFHRYLIEGIEVRHVGDYSMSPVSKEDSSEQIARAEEFLRVAEEKLGGADAE